MSEKPVTPLVTVDCLVVSKDGRLLLIKRKHPPFAGQWALPGGFVEVGETIEEAFVRELYEETGVIAKNPMPVGNYSDPNRDPRGHTISLAYAELVGTDYAKAGDEVTELKWVSLSDVPSDLAFDHNKMVKDLLLTFATLVQSRLI